MYNFVRDDLVTELCFLQPLTPTGAMPDMATLRLIKESELRKGAIIGSGAFGTVFKVLNPPLSQRNGLPRFVFMNDRINKIALHRKF